MGGRVVDRARLESVFTFIGNEGSNPSPSGLLAHKATNCILRDEELQFDEHAAISGIQSMQSHAVEPQQSWG